MKEENETAPRKNRIPIGPVDLIILGVSFSISFVLAMLKQYGIIDWSWLVITAPIWGVFVVCLIMGISIALLYILLVAKRRYKRRKKIRKLMKETHND